MDLGDLEKFLCCASGSGEDVNAHSCHNAGEMQRNGTCKAMFLGHENHIKTSMQQQIIVTWVGSRLAGEELTQGGLDVDQIRCRLDDVQEDFGWPQIPNPQLCLQRACGLVLVRFDASLFDPKLMAIHSIEERIQYAAQFSYFLRA